MARKSYCTGCGVTFPKVHLMRQHRNRERCGGRFLPFEKVLEIEQRRPKKKPKESSLEKWCRIENVLIDSRTAKLISNDRRVEGRCRRELWT